MRSAGAQGLRRSNEALALAKALTHPHSLVFAWGYAYAPRFADPNALQEAVENVTALSAEYGFMDFLPAAAFYHGWMMTQQGSTEEGIAFIRQSLVSFRVAGI